MNIIAGIRQFERVQPSCELSRELWKWIDSGRSKVIIGFRISISSGSTSRSTCGYNGTLGALRASVFSTLTVRMQERKLEGSKPTTEEVEEDCVYLFVILKRLLHQGSGHCQNNCCKDRVVVTLSGEIVLHGSMFRTESFVYLFRGLRRFWV